MKKGKGKPKLANCSPNDVVRALNKLGAFTIKEGTNHIRITHIETNRASTIPRHNPVDRNLLKDFVEDYLIKELGYSEEEIYKYLWC